MDVSSAFFTGFLVKGGHIEMFALEVAYYVLKCIGAFLAIVWYSYKLYKEFHYDDTMKKWAVCPTQNGSLGWDGSDNFQLVIPNFVHKCGSRFVGLPATWGGLTTTSCCFYYSTFLPPCQEYWQRVSAKILWVFYVDDRTFDFLHGEKNGCIFWRSMV